MCVCVRERGSLGEKTWFLGTGQWAFPLGIHFLHSKWKWIQELTSVLSGWLDFTSLSLPVAAGDGLKDSIPAFLTTSHFPAPAACVILCVTLLLLHHRKEKISQVKILFLFFLNFKLSFKIFYSNICYITLVFLGWRESQLDSKWEMRGCRGWSDGGTGGREREREKESERERERGWGGNKSINDS